MRDGETSSMHGFPKEIEEEYSRVISFECRHSNADLRCYTSKNGAKSYAEQCMTCGCRVRAIKKTDIGFEPPECDRDIQKSYHDRRMAKIDELRGKKLEMMRSMHRDYLGSPEWREVRQVALQRDAGKCQGCLNEKATQVHHTTYARWGCELLIDLVSLCNSCHDRCHSDEAINEVLENLSRRIVNIGQGFWK